MASMLEAIDESNRRPHGVVHSEIDYFDRPARAKRLVKKFKRYVFGAPKGKPNV